MHLSKLLISNYRSIQELTLKFEKGKNIIVGKNNAGKSNIIKAIDLILGEGSPTWQKSECNPPLNRTVYKVTIHLNFMELLVCWKPSIGFQHTNGL
jgi:AAA15 family ATPase/GTPase